MSGRTQLSVDLIAKVGGFEAGMKRASASASSTGNRIQKAFKNIGPGLAAGAAGAAAAAAAAGAAAATAIVSAVTAAINRADQLSELSQKIGISTEALSGLNVAAQMSGLSIEQMQGGITRLVRAQNDAATGAGAMAGLFDAIGVSATNADGSLRQTDRVLHDIADVFQAIPDGAEKTALAVAIFGRAGADLIPMLNAGSESLRDFDALAERLGVRLSGESGLAAEAFNDNLTMTKIALQGIATQIAVELLPDLVALTDSFTKNDNRARDFADSARSLVTFLGGIVDVGRIVKNVVEGIFLGIVGVVDAAQTLIALGNPFQDIVGLLGGESRLETVNRNFREGGVATGMALEAFGRAGNVISGTPSSAGAAAPSIQFITPDTLATAAGPPTRGRDGEAIIAALAAQREAADKQREATVRGAAASRDAAQAERERTKAIADARAADDQRTQAAADYTRQLEDYRAQLSGPLAEAELAWERRKQQLQDLADRGQVSQAQLAEGLGLLTQARDRDTAAITAQLTPAQQVIADLEAERALLGLSNVDRQIANALRFAGVNATKAERAEIAENIRLFEEARERMQFNDDIRRGFEDTFASIIDGSSSAKDALGNLGSFITSLIAQRLSAQLVDSLFGKPGTPMGGSGIGGLLSSAIGSLFGGGRAAGGWVAPGKMYEVGESGPELLRVGNRQFLLPTATGGMVTPNARMGGGGGVVQNITVQGRIDTRTAAQLARETQRAQGRASARFGA